MSFSMCCSTGPLLPEPPPAFSRSSRNLPAFRDSEVTVLDPAELLSTVGAAESATDARDREEQ